LIAVCRLTVPASVIFGIHFEKGARHEGGPVMVMSQEKNGQLIQADGRRVAKTHPYGLF
jgi:hypothetical protein